MDQTPERSLGLARSHPSARAGLLGRAHGLGGPRDLWVLLRRGRCRGGWARPGSHRAKDDASRRLHDEHGLPSVSDLLFTLNQARKHEAYGDVERPAHLDPEDVALAVEEYVGSVEALLQQ